MRHILSFTLVALLLAACSSKDEKHEGHSSKPAEAMPKYHCPMHPTYVDTKPGSCPICGMDLVPIDNEVGATTGQTPSVEGRTTVFISPERREQVGVVSTPVESKTLIRTLRLPGTIEYPESSKVLISPRIGGWIREVYVASAGERVEIGQPLFTVYSPDILSTQREYVQALKSKEPGLIAAARRRLELWSVREEEIAALESGEPPSETIVIRSPVKGIITEKMALPGMAFMPGEKLFEIADPSTVWLHAFIFEQDLRMVQTGQQANVTVSALPNHLYSATLDLVYPSVDEVSRRTEVRFTVDNSDFALRGDMWVTVELEEDLGAGLTIPASAIIDTGKRQVAFVDREDGHLEPRDVKIEARTDNEVRIRKGLAEGERVVTRALFLVDSESQLKAAISGLSSSGHDKHGQ